MTDLNKSGNTVVIALVAVVVIAVAGVVGYMVTNNPKTTTKSTTVIKTESVPNSIKSKDDLDQANKALDSTDIDGSTNTSGISNEL